MMLGSVSGSVGVGVCVGVSICVRVSDDVGKCKQN